MTEIQLNLLNEVVLELRYQAGINDDAELREVADALFDLLEQYKMRER